MFLPSTLLYLVSLVVFVVVFGLVILRLMHFKCSSRLDMLLATYAAGLSGAGCLVYLLLLLGAYYAWIVLLLFSLSAAYLARSYFAKSRILPPAPSVPGDKTAGISLTGLDAVAIFVCGLLLLLQLWDASSSPIQFWDGSISWDKWATQWAKRTHLYQSAQGGYPQLLPMFHSLLYKLTANVSVVAPAEQYAVHAFSALVGFVLLAACVRAGQLFRTPVWIVLLLTFGFKTLREMVVSGTPDLLLTTLILIYCVLAFGWTRGYWSSKLHGAPLLALCLFGALFAKLAGMFLFLFAAASALLWNRAGDSAKVQVPRLLRAACFALPLILLAPFYMSQYTSSHQAPAELDTFEVNYSLNGMAAHLRATTDQSYTYQAFPGKLVEAGRRLLEQYSILQPAPRLSSALLLIMASMAFFSRLHLPLGITWIAIAALWFTFTAYDARNLLPAVPLLALCISHGASVIQNAIPRFVVLRILVLGTAGFFALAMSGGILQTLTQLANESVANGSLSTRVRLMNSEFPQRIASFFPTDYELWQFLSGSRLLHSASHFAVGSYSYRWHERGMFCLSGHVNQEAFGPGDIFAVLSWRPAPLTKEYDQWTMLRSDEWHVWFWEKNPVQAPVQSLQFKGDPAPRLISSNPGWIDIEPGGRQSSIVYGVPDLKALEGVTIVWRVILEADRADPAIAACALPANPGASALQTSRTAIDASQASVRVIKYSGSLIIPPQPQGANSQRINL